MHSINKTSRRKKRRGRHRRLQFEQLAQRELLAVDLIADLDTASSEGMDFNSETGEVVLIGNQEERILSTALISVVAIAEDPADQLALAVNDAEGEASAANGDGVAPPFTFHDPGDGSYALTARNPDGVQEPGVSITHNGTSIDTNTYQVIDLNDKVPGVVSFPTTLTDNIANTFLRASYQKQDGTTGSLTTSVVASPSFRSDDQVFHYIPDVDSAAVVTNGTDYYRNTLTGTFPGPTTADLQLATLETIRIMPDPGLGQTTVQIHTSWDATNDIALATGAAFAGNDRLRELTVSSMFSSETEFDANLIRFEDVSGAIHSITLTNQTARDSHLFDEPVEVGGWFELAKTTDSTWQPDSPSTRIRIANDGGVRLGLQGWLAATKLTSDDSLTVWLEDLDSPDVIPAGTQRSLRFEMIATPPVPYDYGDASGQYPTVLAEDGARHAILNELFLGSGVGGEADGQPSPDASADDQEDGVQIVAAAFSSSTTDSTASIRVEASAAGKLDAWLDFNRDGDWSDLGEQIAAAVDVSGGPNVLAYTVPAGLSAGDTTARFRFSSAGGLEPTGMAADGEVEDYWFTIGAASGTREATIASPGSGTLFVVDASRIAAAHDGAVIFDAERADIDILNIEHDTDDTLEIAGQWTAQEGAIVDGKFQHVFTSGDVTMRIINTKPWQNPILPFDTDGSGFVTPRDLLLTINELNVRGSHSLPFPQSPAEVTGYFDASGDQIVAPLDVVLAVDYLNRQAHAARSEGEAPAANESLFSSNVPEPIFPADRQQAVSASAPRGFAARKAEVQGGEADPLFARLVYEAIESPLEFAANPMRDLASSAQSSAELADDFWNQFDATSDLFD